MPAAAPSSQTAWMPTRVASRTSVSESPLMTISSTDAMSGSSREATWPAQRRAIGVVGRGHQCLVLGADLGAGARDAAGEGQEHVGQPPDRVAPPPRRPPGPPRRPQPEHQEVAAADRAGARGVLLAEELAVHHRYAPVAPPADLLGDLVPVAEEAQVPAQRYRLFALHAGEDGRGRAGQHALTDPALHLLRQLITRDGEQQHADTGPAVGRFCGVESRTRCRPRRRSR